MNGICIPTYVPLMLKRLTYKHITYTLSFSSSFWVCFYYSCEANICYSEIIRLYFPFHNIKWCQIGQPLLSRPRIGVDRRKSQTPIGYTRPLDKTDLHYRTMCVKDADHFQIQVALLKMRRFNAKCQLK